ncbi:MAG TPA: TonB family protein, partial [Mucilaginibacter sp.]
KQRIMMLQKNKSQKVVLIKYLLSAPLFILMLILSSATINNSKTIRLINIKAQQVFLAPATVESIGVKTSGNHVNKTGVKHTLSSDDTIPGHEELIFTSVEQVPEFPGGVEAFGDFLAKTIKYPVELRLNKIQGRVIVSFIVETDGSLSNFRVARGIGYGADEEAIRALALSPKWKPGIQNGHLVRVAYSVPIAFTLDDTKPGKAVETKTGAVIEIETDGNSVTVINERHKTNADTANKIVDVRLDGLTIHHPLVILDGKEIANVNMVNPMDIQSISVLKDASATALYGVMGANGVVLIVTKKTLFKINPVAPKKN